MREEFRKKQKDAQGKARLVFVDKATVSAIEDADDVTLFELPMLQRKDYSELSTEIIPHKKTKVVTPKDATSKASPSSVGFGKVLSSLITLPHDLLKRDTSSPVVCSDQALARFAQGMAWVVAEARQTANMKFNTMKLALKKRKRLLDFMMS